jgi:type III restriction enzyme
MGRRTNPAQPQEAPIEAPVQAVDDPILCSPFEEPREHWIYDRGTPKRSLGRRPAGYFFKTERTGSAQTDLFAEENRDDLPLVNALRADVKRWRESGYRGASQVTQDLIRHWRDERRQRRLFFCQIEAVETIIYLLELRISGNSRRTGFREFALSDVDLKRLLAGEAPHELGNIQSTAFPRLCDPPADPSWQALRRLGCKMATGSGKTIVMGMLIAWAFCNRGRNPSSTDFPNAVLVVAPNLTVKNRLAVLRPEDSSNYYELFDLVPLKYREYLSLGKVLVTNWHVFGLKSSGSEGGVTYKVVDKGEEDEVAFTRDRLGELAQRLPLLVLNDEAHHCWRPRAAEPIEDVGDTKEDKRRFKEEVEEARVWLDGLDRINNCRLAGADAAAGTSRAGILAAIDLSATPFYLAGSGFPEGAPFPWLVSDFGLVDAIESGIVKIPRIPVKQVMPGDSPADAAGRPDPEYFRLWDHMVARMGPHDRLTKTSYKPASIYAQAEGALSTLYAQWVQRFRQYQDAIVNRTSEVIPPAMIVVCPDTDTAAYFYERISGERTVGEGKGAVTAYDATNFPELRNDASTVRTFRIDSELLSSLTSDEEASKDEHVSRMREIIDTIGKPGKPGEHVRCIVSVSMLTEGWDANNVTQILGVRPFRSQLLCEQVVGRGLRRRSYATRKVDLGNGRTEDRLEPEYVDVYGIPFSLIPFKGRDQDGPEPTEDRPTNHVHAVPEKEHLAIEVPRVENFTYELTDAGVRCDVDTLPELVLVDMPAAVDVEAVRGYKDDVAAVQGVEQDMERQGRDEYYANINPQRIAFTIAQRVTARLMEGQRGLPPEKRVDRTARFFADVYGITTAFMDRRVRLKAGQDIRDLGFDVNLTRAVETLSAGIQTGFTGGAAAKLMPVVNRMRPTLRSADAEEHTKRPVRLIEKSHLNALAPRSKLETQIAKMLDWSDHVEAWVPNTRGFDLRLEYEHDGKERLYEPDYVVRLKMADGSRKHVIIEVKGAGGEIWDEQSVRAKEIVARRWCTAVNNAGAWGAWDYEIVRDAGLLDEVLARHAGVVTPPLPYRIVTDARKSDRWKTCVPRVPLAVAAGGFSDDQESLFSEDAHEWIEWDGMPSPEEGMFVARISGTSMEPDVPNGSWCLFRQPRAGSRNGKLLVVQHASVSEAGFPVGLTLKRYRSERVVDQDTGELRHSRIVLEPLNADHRPLELAASEGDDGTAQLRVIAEFVCVIG